MPSIVRHVSWALASLIVGIGLSIAAAAPEGETGEKLAFVVVAISVAAVVLLLAHQPWGRVATSSAISLLAAFVVPLLLAREVPDVSACRPPRRVPCDPAMGLWHPDVLLALFVVFLAAALGSSVAGLLRYRTRGRQQSG